MEIPLLIKVLSLPFELTFMYKCMCTCKNCTESECGCMQGIQKSISSRTSSFFRSVINIYALMIYYVINRYNWLRCLFNHNGGVVKK